MSFKSKDLQYEKQEPAFLRRLKGNYAAADGRHNVQIARPQKQRLKTGDDDEDEPVVIDENGNVISKTDFANLQKDEATSSANDADRNQISSSDSHAEGTTDKVHQHQQQVAEIGGPKKRKIAKAIGIDDDNDETVSKTENHSDKSEDQMKPPPAKSSSSIKKQSDKIKKKAKKIKLSFDEPE